MKTALLFASLAMSAGLAHAEERLITPSSQRLTIDRQIDARNKLVSELNVRANSKEAVLLAAINSHELTVLYTLQVFEDSASLAPRVQGSKTKTSNAGLLAKVGASLHSICTIQKLDMSTTNIELEQLNPKLAKSVADQINNIEVACDLISKAALN